MQDEEVVDVTYCEELDKEHYGLIVTSKELGLLCFLLGSIGGAPQNNEGRILLNQMWDKWGSEYLKKLARDKYMLSDGSGTRLSVQIRTRYE